MESQMVIPTRPKVKPSAMETAAHETAKNLDKRQQVETLQRYRVAQDAKGLLGMNRRIAEAAQLKHLGMEDEARAVAGSGTAGEDEIIVLGDGANINIHSPSTEVPAPDPVPSDAPAPEEPKQGNFTPLEPPTNTAPQPQPPSPELPSTGKGGSLLTKVALAAAVAAGTGGAGTGVAWLAGAFAKAPPPELIVHSFQVVGDSDAP